MNHSAFSKIWIIVITVVLVTGGIFAWQYFEMPKQEVVPEVVVPEEVAPEDIVKDEIVDWEIYRNKEYGYEIKYLKNWQLDLRDAPSLVRFDVEKNNFLTLEELKTKWGEHVTDYHFRFITWDDVRIRVFSSFDQFVDFMGDGQYKNLDEWIEGRMENFSISKNSKKEIVVNKYEGIEVEEIGYGSYRSIFLIRSPFIYYFQIDTSHEKMDIFDQMLSTFRFLE